MAPFLRSGLAQYRESLRAALTLRYILVGIVLTLISARASLEFAGSVPPPLVLVVVLVVFIAYVALEAAEFATRAREATEAIGLASDLEGEQQEVEQARSGGSQPS